MAGKFAEASLGQLLSFANGRSSPERSGDLPYPVYGSNGMIGYAKETNTDAKSIIIGRVGSYCGALYWSKEPCWVTDNAICASALGNNDSRFLFYLLSTLNLNNWRGGSGQPLLNQDILRNIPTFAPEPNVQRAIAHILGTLDDKIELNRRMNETLEAIAQAIFKSWFVDTTQDGLPEDWRESTIGKEVKVVGGSTPSTSNPEFWEGGKNCWATPKDLASLTTSVLLDTERRITDAGVQQISSGLLPIGTVLLSSRAPIGYLAVAEVPVAVNQGFIAMICDGSLTNHYIRLWTKQNIEIIKGRANGTTFLEISKSNFRPLPILVPPQPMIDAFQKQVEPLYLRIVSNIRESRTLAALRDTLLPKLISGEIGVKDAERFIGRAG